MEKKTINYLVSYSFSGYKGFWGVYRTGRASVTFTKSTPIEDPSDLEELSKILRDNFLEEDNLKNTTIVIENIIKFPIK